MKIKFDCKSPEELEEAAEILVNYYKNSRVFAFSGEMGAGKTSFIKAICRELGAIDSASSPTYSLVNEYVTAGGRKIYHFDFYRIAQISEAVDIGFEEYLDSGEYCFIEWPEKVSGILPSDVIMVNIAQKDEGRLITMSDKKDLQKA
jgi:tRNA threonylcarbamoyladenosine biosynthesis protein TsaE